MIGGGIQKPFKASVCGLEIPSTPIGHRFGIGEWFVNSVSHEKHCKDGLRDVGL